MAWTDYSNTPANAWDASIGAVYYSSNMFVAAGDETVFDRVSVSSTAFTSIPNFLAGSYNIPGFDGYQPSGVNNPINGDLGGGGGPTRPTSGFLYPRGQG